MLVTLLAIILIPLVGVFSVGAVEIVELTPTENHHIVELNSNQPYVAGYHVNAPNLDIRERVQATTITVSFPSTDTDYFPPDSWLGAGMFVQGQDSKIINVDYGFYTVLVLDAAGDFFLDVGLHQTRESTAPLQMPTEELLYAYTWRVSGIDPATPVTLLATWDSDGFVHYSLSTSESNITVASVNVSALPNCESVIRQFYAGDATNSNAFPLTRYVHYFQFGVVSSKAIDTNRWSADLKDPKILRKTGWDRVEVAWSTQGDLCLLDSDWMWGGKPYPGVSAQYYRNPLVNLYEVVFFYSGQSLAPGTVLWQNENSEFHVSTVVSSSQLSQALAAVGAFGIVSVAFRIYKLKKTRNIVGAADRSNL
jgi:hypothetical protein